jgi:diguanylate cyclase (GGDEF)-like protein
MAVVPATAAEAWMRQRILIVEDNQVTATLLRRAMERELGLVATVAGTLAETAAALESQGPEAFALCLVDLYLPDAPGGEALDFLLAKGMPCIVFTGEFNDEVREQMVAKKVIDYLLKENAASVHDVVRLVGRIRKNEAVKILVVDDSATARRYLRQLLERRRFQVMEARSGVEALELLSAHGDVSLVIADYHMPEMDGAELTKRIREKADMNSLAIIGVSAVGNHPLSARFLKNGANDFIIKPFLEEEFHCRVAQNVSLLETIRALKEASFRDSLTGLHNRRYFNEAARQAYATMRRGRVPFTLGMIDLDFFKRINDTYGHEAGDEVLRAVGYTLGHCVRESDILSRIGGEEFCILASNMAPGPAAAYFERARARISELTFTFQGQAEQITASIGVCTQAKESLEAMMNSADAMLYQAKSGGRNRTLVDA